MKCIIMKWLDKQKEKKLNINFIKVLERDLEIEKEQANVICSQSNCNIVTITLLSTALIEIIFGLMGIEQYESISDKILLFSGILMFILFVSLTFATLSHFMYKQAFPANPEDLLKKINKNRNFFENDGFIEQKKYDLMEMYKSIRKNNAKRKLFLRISFIGIWIFMIMFFIFGITIYVKVENGGNNMVEEKEKLVEVRESTEDNSRALSEGELTHSEIASKSSFVKEKNDIGVGNDNLAPVEIRYETEKPLDSYENDNSN